jgi:hypothetical protein
VTGLREQLEAKQRRRLVQPIQISNPSADQQTWLGVTAALQIEQSRPDGERNDATEANLQKRLDEAWERYRSHFVDVELQSMPRDDWNAAMTEWQGEDGVDWAVALAPLLAASCTDPELQDAQWWQSQLDQDSWSEGDTNGLRMALLALNVDGLDARLPKD